MIDDLKRELERLTVEGRRRELGEIDRSSGALITVRGKTLVNFADWDLLGLNQSAKSKRAAQQAIEDLGCGGGSPRGTAGSARVHKHSESRIAKFFNLGSALLFSSRNQAVFSLFSALLNERDILIVDEMVQSPGGDAAYLVNCAVASVKLASPGALANELERHKAARRRCVVCEEVSSISGERIQLAPISAVCAKYDAQLFVDVSLSTVCYGLDALQRVGTTPLVSLPPFGVFGDNSIAFGSFGGFVAGPEVLVQYLINRSRTIQSEPSVPAALAAGCYAGIEQIELAPLQQEEIRRRADRLRTKLREMNVPGVVDSPTPLVCIALSKASRAIELSTALLERGFFVDAVARGTLLNDTGYLRVIVTVQHTERQIEELAATIAELFPRVII